MHIGPHLFDGAQGIGVIGKGQVRMNAAHHVDLGDGLVKPFPDLVPDIVHAHLIGLGMALFLAKGAELTEIGADVGIVDVLVVNKKGLIAVLALPHQIGQVAKGDQIRGGIETLAIF